MPRYTVQVIGSGRQCFVVANLPGDGGYRRGPMPEEEALELAHDLSDQLRGIGSDRKEPDARPVVWFLIAAAFAFIGFAIWLVVK